MNHTEAAVPRSRAPWRPRMRGLALAGMAVFALAAAVTATEPAMAMPSSGAAASGAGYPRAQWRTSWGAGFGTGLPNGCSPMSAGLAWNAWWDPADVQTSGGALTISATPKPARYGGGGYGGGGYGGGGYGGGGYGGGGWPNPPASDATFGALGCPGRAQTYGRFVLRARASLDRSSSAYFVLWPADHASDAAATAPARPLVLTPPVWVHPQPVSVPIPATAGTYRSFIVDWTPTALTVSSGSTVLTRVPSPSDRRWPAFVIAPTGFLSGAPAPATASNGSFTVDELRTYAYSACTPACGQPSASAPATPRTPPAGAPAPASASRASAPGAPSVSGSTDQPATSGGTVAPGSSAEPSASSGSPVSSALAAAPRVSPASARTAGSAPMPLRAGVLVALTLALGAGLALGRRIALTLAT